MKVSKLQMYLLLYFLFASTSSHAGHAPDFTIQTEKNGSELNIIATPPSGHHFNIEAPHFMQEVAIKQPKPIKIKASNKDKHQLVFKAQGDASEVEISAFLCDDKNTFCENHVVHLTTSSQKEASNPMNEPTQEPTGQLNKDEQVKQGFSNGFILNEPKAALKKAKTEDKFMIIDFFGIWCPPCNQLDDEVFPSEEFKKASADFVKLKLDADSTISWELKSRYRVGGYPTVVFTNSQGDEISRIVGYRDSSFFAKTLKDIMTSSAEGFSKLKNEANLGDPAKREKLGLLYLARDDFKSAFEHLKDVPTRQEESIAAELGLWTQLNKAQKNKNSIVNPLIEVLERSLKLFSDIPEAVEREAQLAEIYGDPKNEKANEEKKVLHLNRAITIAKELLVHPEKLKNKDYTAADLLESIGTAQEELGLRSESQKSWAKAVSEYKKQLKTGNERGINLNLAFALWKSGDFEAASALYIKFEKMYPSEVTFFYQHAAMDFAREKYSDAEQNIKKALKCSYGDNELRSAILLAKIYKAQGLPEKAKQLATAKLKALKLPTDENNRIYALVAALKAIRDKQ